MVIYGTESTTNESTAGFLLCFRRQPRVRKYREIAVEGMVNESVKSALSTNPREKIETVCPTQGGSFPGLLSFWDYYLCRFIKE